MRKTNSLSACPTAQETAGGVAWLVVQYFLLPSLVPVLSLKLHLRLNSAQINFIYFFLNFLAVVCIFHSFLGRNSQAAWQHPALLCQAVILGLAGHFFTNYLLGWLTEHLLPSFSNFNDTSIASLIRGDRFLMLLGTVFLVPPVEEVLFRGLIFRNLYSQSRPMAYCISVLAFAAIHVLSFMNTYSPLELAWATFTYLPVGMWLAWAYVKSGSIVAPILIHAVINTVGIAQLR